MVGPMVNERQRDRVAGYIEAGRAEGAKVAFGGERLLLPSEISDGWFVLPTLFTDVRNSMRIAVRIANDTRYGLSGSVWSGDHERALGIARRMRTGMVSLNGRFRP